jgi:intracellular septation protein A
VKQALRQLLSDFLSAILFLVVYAVSGSLFAAAGIAVAAALVQLARLRLTRRRIEPIQWMSLGLVVVLGGATMLTQSPRFMMIKPTIVHFAVASVMLRRGWMLRYLPELVLRNVPEPTIVAAGYAWAALLAALGLANLFIALRLGFAAWAWFISLGSVGAKLAAFALQYGIFRAIVRQRLAQSAGCR